MSDSVVVTMKAPITGVTGQHGSYLVEVETRPIVAAILRTTRGWE